MTVRFHLFLLIYFCNSILIAQYPIMRNYNVDDGLPGSQVYHTFEDSKGFIWISTDMGVSRFDGYAFKTFTVLDGLPSNDVWGVAEDKEGKLWLSTFNEIVYIEDDKVNRFPIPDSLKNYFSVINHWIDAYNIHKIVTTGKFSFFKSGESLFPIHNRMSADFRSKILFSEDESNQMLFDIYRAATAKTDEKERLIYIDEEYYPDGDGWLRNTLESFKKGKKGVPVSITHFGKNKILCCANNQMRLIDIHNQKITSLSFPCNSKTFLNRIDTNLIWSQGEESIFLDENAEEVQEFRFLNDYPLNTIYTDHNSNLWVNTKDGVYFLSANSRYSQNYALPENAGSHEIQSMVLDSAGLLWLGSSNGHLYSFEKSRGIVKRVDRLMDAYYNGMVIDRNGKFYSGGDYFYIIPIDLLKSKQSLNIQKTAYQVWSETLCKNHINLKDIIIQGDSNVYFTSSTSPCQVVDNEVIEYITEGWEENSYIYTLAIDEVGTIWSGKKSGVGQLINGRNKLLNHLNPLFNRPINDLLCNKQELWVATDGYGLFRYQDEQIDTIFELQNEIIKKIHIDNQGRVWAATNKGIGKITIQKESSFEYDFQRLTTAHGLNSNEVNQVLVDHTTIYVATKKGLSILNDEKLNEYASRPPVHFTSCSINGRDTSIVAIYDLKYHENNINIGFVCLSYESQGNISYQYKMEGVDKEWKTTTSLKKEYPLLPPGNYTFMLNAKDINGHQANGPISIQFNICPPWWKTLTFQITALLVFLALAFGLMQYRIWRIRKKMAEKAEIEKKFAELELRALQAQMNPHFVFNALHSIQDFIFRKDERVANAYLVKFSRLMRLFLESSKEKSILLEDEIKLLQLYIDLEKLRFEEKFDYRLEIDPQIEPKLIEIPSMLFQPFVENAINHGLIYKESKGLLSVWIKKDQNLICCIIEDDGIGRARAAELKNQSYKSYKSRGMKLVEERQRVLNFINESDIRIEIIDLTDENGQATGTKVMINIPFFE